MNVETLDFYQIQRGCIWLLRMYQKLKNQSRGESNPIKTLRGNNGEKNIYMNNDLDSKVII